MPKAKTIQLERLRREKISKTLKEKYRNGLVSWNKGETIETDERIRKIRYWLGKKNSKLSEALKGKPTWNKGLKGYLSGEKHYNWKGGVTEGNNKIHGSAEYKNWRKSVFKRDNFTCQICDERGTYLVAHHIKSFTYFPKLRFEIDNGITLCKNCHKIYHKIFGKTLKNPANSVNSNMDNAELTRIMRKCVETIHGTPKGEDIVRYS